MKAKRTFLAALILLTVFALPGSAGCGTDEFNASADYSDANGAGYSDSDSASWDSSGSGGVKQDAATDDAAAEAAVPENNAASDAALSAAETAADFGMDTDMLIYNCDLVIDTLAFDQSVADFKAALVSAEGFVEKENYYDNYHDSGFYVEEKEKKRTYEATVRVPSGRYGEFLEGAGSLGDVRTQNAYVENVSQEYTDLATALEIYEAKEQRYINLLSTITDDQYALEVERELMDIEIQIAQLKTRMNRIRTDVAYSYINITIREVREYTETKSEDTFSQRMLNRIQDSWHIFLYVAEGLLVIFIMLFPYLLILLTLILLILLLNRRYKKKVQQRISRETEQND